MFSRRVSSHCVSAGERLLAGRSWGRGAGQGTGAGAYPPLGELGRARGRTGGGSGGVDRESVLEMKMKMKSVRGVFIMSRMGDYRQKTNMSISEQWVLQIYI